MIMNEEERTMVRTELLTEWKLKRKEIQFLEEIHDYLHLILTQQDDVSSDIQKMFEDIIKKVATQIDESSTEEHFIIDFLSYIDGRFESKI